MRVLLVGDSTVTDDAGWGQFGHNDQPGKGPERETEPETGYAANLARYLTEARAAGMRPALVTSLTRRDFDERSGQLSDTLAPYVAAARRVATGYGAPLIDLHAASVRLCTALGPDGCAALSARKPDGTVDATHLNEAGGARFGAMVADLAREAVTELRLFIEPRR
jgi:lysophospholipase L1-like esterase